MAFASMQNTVQFHRRLTETITWCMAQPWSFQRLEWGKSYVLPSWLRTEALRPPEVVSNWNAIDKRPTVLPHHQAFMAPECADILTAWREETARLHALDHAKQKQQWLDNGEQVAMRRAALIQEHHLALADLRYPLHTGRLLIFDPDQTTTDGAPTVSTGGFFNDDDVPAWDTWIAYVIGDPISGGNDGRHWDSYVLSWVPDSLVAMVEDGMDCISIPCHYWVDDLDSPLIRLLRQSGCIS
jgi:hypothetical protein